MFKGQVQCYSMQVVMNKCFLLVGFEKNTEIDFNSDALKFRKNNGTDPKARLL